MQLLHADYWALNIDGLYWTVGGVILDLWISTASTGQHGKRLWSMRDVNQVPGSNICWENCPGWWRVLLNFNNHWKSIALSEMIIDPPFFSTPPEWREGGLYTPICGGGGGCRKVPRRVIALSRFHVPSPPPCIGGAAADVSLSRIFPWMSSRLYKSGCRQVCRPWVSNFWFSVTRGFFVAAYGSRWVMHSTVCTVERWVFVW